MSLGVVAGVNPSNACVLDQWILPLNYLIRYVTKQPAIGYKNVSMVGGPVTSGQYSVFPIINPSVASGNIKAYILEIYNLSMPASSTSNAYSLPGFAISGYGALINDLSGIKFIYNGSNNTFQIQNTTSNPISNFAMCIQLYGF
jgi:hypothetical protein